MLMLEILIMGIVDDFYASEFEHDPCFIYFFTILETRIDIPPKLKSKFKYTNNMKLLPKTQGIYFLIQNNSQIMYIGETENLRKRLYSHKHKKIAKHIYYLEFPFVPDYTRMKVCNIYIGMRDIESLLNNIIEPVLNKAYSPNFLMDAGIKLLNLCLKLLVREHYSSINFDNEFYLLVQKFKLHQISSYNGWWGSKL